jgi:hypothetical protein
MGRVPKRLKTGDEPNAEAVKVKVKSYKDEEEEEEKSSNNDNDEEEEQVVQPVAQVKRPGCIPSRPYVPPRPNYILMDYDESMGGEVIPDNKVIRPMNRWCYTKLDPVYWGENSIERCPTYGGTYRKALPHVFEQGRDVRMYVENTIKQQRFEATHIDAQVDRVQVTHCIDPWGYAAMEWRKNRMIEKYQDMKMNGEMIATDDKIKLRAVQTVRLIRRGLLEEGTSGEYDFPLNQVRVLDPEKYRYWK